MGLRTPESVLRREKVLTRRASCVGIIKMTPKLPLFCAYKRGKADWLKSMRERNQPTLKAQKVGDNMQAVTARISVKEDHPFMHD